MAVTAQVDAESDFVSAGSVDRFEIDRFVIIDHPAGSVGVVRREEGYYAVSNRCPHMGAPICVGSDVKLTTAPSRPFEYCTDSETPVVRCPWHRWEFGLCTGESVGKVTRSRLMTYPVKVVDGVVLVGTRANRNPARK
jgi:nitrite reductase/ring-hydroxylating ferredoxin subunit